MDALTRATTGTGGGGSRRRRRARSCRRWGWLGQEGRRGSATAPLAVAVAVAVAAARARATPSGPSRASRWVGWGEGVCGLRTNRGIDCLCLPVCLIRSPSRVVCVCVRVSGVGEARAVPAGQRGPGHDLPHPRLCAPGRGRPAGLSVCLSVGAMGMGMGMGVAWCFGDDE